MEFGQNQDVAVWVGPKDGGDSFDSLENVIEAFLRLKGIRRVERREARTRSRFQHRPEAKHFIVVR